MGMKALRRPGRWVLGWVMVLGCLAGWTTGPLEAASPLSVLHGHRLEAGSGRQAAGEAVNEAKLKAARVILNTDGLMSRAADRAFMQRFKTELEKLGVTATISPHCSVPNNHVLTVRNCPKGYWVVTAASGICAGTFRDMVLARKGYLKSSWEKNQIAGLIFLNLSPHLLKGLGYLRRAWDDNFSPRSFQGIPKPYDYIRGAGYYVAESSTCNRPVLNPGRVPILAKQIAEIVLGRTDGGAESAEAGETGLILRRVPQEDDSQDGEQVKELQRALQACGYYQGFLIDGWFGPYTEEAVMAFQRDHNLNVTGIVGPQLLRYILESAKSGRRPGAAAGTFAAPADLAALLKPTAHCEVNDPGIVGKAKALRGATPEATVANVFAFAQKIKYGRYENSRKGAVGTLKAGSGNCCDQANLIVALLRANGIPAKYGHSRDCKFRSGSRSGHVWAYAWVGGQWQALDSTSSRNRVGALNSFTVVAPVKTYDALPF